MAKHPLSKLWLATLPESWADKLVEVELSEIPETTIFLGDSRTITPDNKSSEIECFTITFVGYNLQNQTVSIKVTMDVKVTGPDNFDDILVKGEVYDLNLRNVTTGNVYKQIRCFQIIATGVNGTPYIKIGKAGTVAEVQNPYSSES